MRNTLERIRQWASQMNVERWIGLLAGLAGLATAGYGLLKRGPWATPVPLWFFAAGILLSVSATIWGVRKLSRKTYFVYKTDDLLEDMSRELGRYIKKFEGDLEVEGGQLPANRIIIYRVFPFEFARELFPRLEGSRRFNDAFEAYSNWLRKIIEEGRADIGDWWDFSVYGGLGDDQADARTVMAIRKLYVTKPLKQIEKDNPPDTSYIFTNTEIRRRGILLIGELDLEKMRDDQEKDKHGNVMPRLKRWHRGYWMIDINYDKGEVKFKNCLITWNQDVLKAMELEFEAIKNRSKMYELSSHMTSQKREEVMLDIESDLLGDGTENSSEETEVGDSGPDDEI